MKKDTVITVDLGGTNLRLGVANRSGEVLLRTRAKMGSYRRKRDLLESLSAAIEEFIPEAGTLGRLRAVCLGFAGYTDSERGLIYFAPNIGGFSNIDVGPYLEKRLRLPVFVENDANCAALGEHWKGAGRGARSLFMFTLGTGVGGGLILNGTIWRGASGTAGEIGHTIVMAGGPRCSCGNRGCLEAFASATAIVKEYFNLVNPELILIGGGVSRAGSILLRPALREAKKIVSPQIAPRLRVRRATLGDDAALIGAARFAFAALK
jgi:glucokinase